MHGFEVVNPTFLEVMIMFLEELSNIPGVSGDEREVRRFIRAALPKRGVTLQTLSLIHI